MRLLLLNVFLLLATLIYVIGANRNGNQLSFDDGDITAEQLTALYKVANPKDVIQEMVKCNVTFFPLDMYQKNRRLRKKIRKYYKRYIRKWKKQQKKLKKLNKVSSDKRGRSVYAVNQTMECIINSNIDYLLTQKLFEGDIIVNSEALQILQNDTVMAALSAREIHNLVRKSTTTNPQAIWPTTIPYTFDSTINSDTQSIIEAAIQRYEDKTCLTFRAKNSGDQDYLEFTSTLGCSSFVGRNGGQQLISLSPSCASPASAEHEIAHALGLFHMHSRYDRDSYVTVHESNILPTSHVNFESYDHATIDHKNLEYDYRSVMHYGEYDYSIGSLKTIEAVNSAPIGMATGLSYLDIVSINLLYQCHEHTPHYWNFDSFHTNNNLAGTTTAEKHGSTGPGEVIELVQGYRKNALHIHSANYVLLGYFPNRCIHDPSRCNSGFSVMFWYKSMDDDSGNNFDVLSSVTEDVNQAGPLDEGFFIHRYPGVFDCGVVYSGNLHKVFASYPGSTTSWHHVAMIWDKSLSSDAIQTYVDGVSANLWPSVQSVQTKAAEQTTLSLGVKEGQDPETIQFQIDDLVIYEKTVTLQDVLDIKDNGPYYDKPANEGSAGHIDTVIPQLGPSQSVAWV